MRTRWIPAVFSCLLLGCPGPQGQPPAEEPVHSPPAEEPASSEKEITSFGFENPAATGAVDAETKAIAVELPAGTAVTALVALFDTTGTSVTVGGVEQESGQTANDFTSPLPYVVAAEDGTLATYTVTVAVPPTPSSEKAITSFSLQSPPAVGAIDAEARVIRARLPAGAPRTALVAELASSGVRVTVGGVEQQSGVTPNDFTLPVEYLVTAEDGTTAAWSVRVTGPVGLMVNELDVDQVGTDTAEYIEIAAVSEEDGYINGIDCAGVVLVLLNGSALPGREYSRIDLAPAGVLAPGSYLVIAGPRVPLPEGCARLSPAGWDSSNRIQNGPNDAVMLFDTIGEVVIDTVSYNGVLHDAALSSGKPVDAAEGDAGAPADSNAVVGSIGRVPDAEDSGQNGADFRFTPTLTPGAPNS